MWYAASSVYNSPVSIEKPIFRTHRSCTYDNATDVLRRELAILKDTLTTNHEELTTDIQRTSNRSPDFTSTL